MIARFLVLAWASGEEEVHVTPTNLPFAPDAHAKPVRIAVGRFSMVVTTYHAKQRRAHFRRTP
jgi:hypothetical protein